LSWDKLVSRYFLSYNIDLVVNLGYYVGMQGNCEKCELPKIVARMGSLRRTAEAASANVKASDSPTQAKPYQEEATTALEGLEDAQRKFAAFVNTWRGTCSNCLYGA
jgi:hypothetical protein